MTRARNHAAVQHAARLLKTRLVLPALAATVVTGSVVGVAVSAIDENPQVAAAGVTAEPVRVSVSNDALVERLEDRRQMVSRSARRVTIAEKPVPTGHRFTTAPLNLRVRPADKAKVVDVLPEATRIAITGETTKGFAEVVRARKAFWVSAEYLAKNKPEPEPEPEPAPAEEATESAPATTEVSGGTCTAAPPSGVTSSAMAVYQAVCSAFPSITTYGGWRGDGEHSGGQAIDIMVSGDLGWQVANYLRANSSRFGLYDVIYAQRIWTAQRSAEGWRYMSDRGSATANHYDHVHVKVF